MLCQEGPDAGETDAKTEQTVPTLSHTRTARVSERQGECVRATQTGERGGTGKSAFFSCTGW